MNKKVFSLRNVVAIVICLVVFSANNVLAQTFNYTDANGVECTYQYQNPNPGDEYIDLTGVVNFPASVTKWVIPEYVPYDGRTVRVERFYGGSGWNGFSVNNTLQEIVFPKQMTFIDAGIFSDIYNGGKFTNLHKVTFGEMMKSPNAYFYQPLDTVVFLGSNIFQYTSDAGGVEYKNLGLLFPGTPATTKVIVPCGTLERFVATFNSTYPLGYVGNQWQQSGSGNNVTWTTANFVEAECLNPLTVLSNDVNLGNAISLSGSSTLTTTTPNSTSTTFSGTATLYALPKVDKVFTGWSDGNTDNPRTVTVSSDTTFTANFASCKETGIMGTQSENSFKAFPNPANNTLNVELKNYVNNGTLTLFDMNGKLVLSQTISGNSAQINMSSLSAGNYILRLVENGTASAGVQVIKQ